MLHGDWLGLAKGKKRPSRLLPVPGTAKRSGGDCGPATAAWLLNEHGPPLYQARSPETPATVRRQLQQSWSELLRKDIGGEEQQTFVLQRLEQTPEAALPLTLDGQVQVVLQALVRGETDSSSDTG